MPYDVPLPKIPWTNIDGNLWIGGHFYDSGRATPGDARPTYEFGYVVSLFSLRGYGPAAGIPHHRCLIDDTELGGADLARVKALVPGISEELDAGHKVLIRCEAGLNRSSLLAALVLLHRGMTAPSAIGLIRLMRSPHALCNPHFVTYIEQAGQRPHMHTATAGEQR